MSSCENIFCCFNAIFQRMWRSCCNTGLRIFVVFVSFLSSNKAVAASEQATIAAVAASQEWRRVLYYVPHWFGGERGLVDTPGFYLASNGAEDPRAELHATLAALHEPLGPDPNTHAICRYPRRTQIIRQSLPEIVHSMPNIICPAYRDWLQSYTINGASLVFSSNYLNNPSSMYGHTFLRLHRYDQTGLQGVDLHDYAINFAANPTTENPLLYAFYGIFGRFYGTFSLMPYFLKVQEYSNAESRDLWEYPLRLDSKELAVMMDSLWEVGPHGIRYWYADENCSFVILALIAAAKPEIAAVDQFPGIVAPKDTVLALQRWGMLGEPKRRLSVYARLSARRAELSDNESKILTHQIQLDSLMPSLMDLPADSQRRVLDALLEWVAYDEKLAGSRAPSRHRQLWEAALAARSRLKSSSNNLVHVGTSERPDHGHSAQRFSLGLMRASQDYHGFLLGFRFALRDIKSRAWGYAEDQEITMGDFQALLSADVSKPKPRLLPKSMRWLHILSVPDFDWLTRAFAWTLNLSSERQLSSGSDAWLSHRIEGGLGAAISLGIVRAYIIPVLAAGHLSQDEPGVNIALGLKSGMLTPLATKQNFGLIADVEHHLVHGLEPTWRVNVFYSLDFSDADELRIELVRESSGNYEIRGLWMRYI